MSNHSQTKTTLPWRQWGQACLIGILIWSGCGAFAMAAEWNISSETILRSFQRPTVQDEDRNLLPVYEYLSIDFGDNESGGLGFHGYGWMRKDLSASQFYPDDPDGELLYGFLTYTHPYSPYKFSLGRQQIFAGAANDSIDGLRLDIGLNSHLALTAYGGIPIDLEDTEGRSGDTVYGGRIALSSAPAIEVGLAYKKVQDNGAYHESTLGADLYWAPFAALSLDGRSAYNLETKGWREHNYRFQMKAGDFELAPAYQFFQYKDYFGTVEKNRNNLFRFLFDSEEKLNVWGADASWKPMESFETGLRGRQYDYDLRTTSALYLSLFLTVDIRSGTTLGVEAGSMDGETPEDSYQLYRAFCAWSLEALLGSSGQASVDILYQAFDEALYGVDTALFASLSAGRSFFNRSLQVMASLNYSQDPFFDNDISGLVTVAFKF